MKIRRKIENETIVFGKTSLLKIYSFYKTRRLVNDDPSFTIVNYPPLLFLI